MTVPKQTCVKSEYLVESSKRFRLSSHDTKPKKLKKSKSELKMDLAEHVEEFATLQRALYAEDARSVLIVFQAMDAAGKDGTIRAVTSGVNPAGFQVNAFKAPSREELDHDFMWRINRALPERGRIGIFNRSHYEETLVVRVHPEYLGAQRLGLSEKRLKKPGPAFWNERFESINDFEKHLARNGTVVIKFFLNVSREEQARRFLKRMDEPESNWKFSAGDVAESRLWKSYMSAYQDVIQSTSKPWAPWYVIPADNKAFMRVQVAKIIVNTLKKMKPRYPKLDNEAFDEMHALRDEVAALVSS